jgi:hypothetical protein
LCPPTSNDPSKTSVARDRGAGDRVDAAVGGFDPDEHAVRQLAAANATLATSIRSSMHRRAWTGRDGGNR